MLIGLFVFTASTAFMHFRSDPSVDTATKLLMNLEPELSHLLAKHDITKCVRGDVLCEGVSSRKSISNRISSMGLSIALTEMLTKDEVGASEDEGESARLLLDSPHRATG